jgi:hypothetical protein
VPTTDFPALFAPGFRALTLTELHRIAVEHPRFRLSRTRAPIMKSLWTLAACITQQGVGNELWVDGSFLTEKIDPQDVDLILVLPENFESNASAEQLGVWNWWDTSEPKGMFQCDTYSLPRLPLSDPDYLLYLRLELYWKKWFGTSRQGRGKGIGRILLPDGCV